MPLRSIDHKQNHIGRVDGHRDLRFDFVRQIVDVLHANAPRIDQFDISLIQLDELAQAISGDASQIIDNGNPPTGNPVENAGFSDVGATDDDNLWNSHSFPIIVEVHAARQIRSSESGETSILGRRRYAAIGWWGISATILAGR